MDEAKVLLEIKNLEICFFLDEGKLYAVNGVDLCLNENEILALVGESGSGKSVSVLSILRLISMPPGKILRGEIHFQGKNLLQLNYPDLCKIRGRKISIIFQDPMMSLNPVMRIGDQIMESLLLHMNMTKKQAKKRSLKLLEMVEISNAEQRLKDYPHQLSGGMRQRVMIAIALSCEPKVLIADEPTTALDVTTQSQIVNLVKKLQLELGMSVIWISHDLGVVARIADRVAVMYAGKIVEQGGVEDIFYRSRHPYTIGLLKSLARMDQPVPEELEEIQGAPPDCIDLPQGCAFAPRCNFTTERCFREVPTLQETEGVASQSACFQWKQCIQSSQ